MNMVYKSKTYTTSDLIEKVEKDRLDMEKIERERKNKLRILRSLPPGLVVTGVSTYPLFGSEGSINIELDGDAEQVVEELVYYFEALPPEPVERVVSSCVWVQPVGHREKGHDHDYESERTKIISICPVWAQASHVADGGSTYLYFEWYTKVSEMIEDGDTHADGGDIVMRVKAQVLHTQQWVRYRCEYRTNHGSARNDVRSENVRHRFVEPVVTFHGGCPGTGAVGRAFYWEDIKDIKDALQRSDDWKSSPRRGY